MRKSSETSRRKAWLHNVRGALLGIVLASSSTTSHAVTIEMKDVAPDRIENQRNVANSEATLPGAPDPSTFQSRLDLAGLKVGDPVFIRIFKAEAELELWIKKDDRFALFATYPVCNWSGTLGPKLAEGDKQTPEGFYTISRQQLHRIGRWPRSLNLGFPNVYDQALARTGSYILVHGGCSSVGCFAMTNPVIEEIYRLSQAAIVKGQDHVPIHVFPFRMTEENLNKHTNSEWHDFWQNLKEGYDAFDQTLVPPRVRVCDSRYQFDRVAPGEGGAESPLEPCGATVAAVDALDEFYNLARSHPLLRNISFKTRGLTWKTASNEVPEHLAVAFEIYRDAMQTLSRAVEQNAKLPRSQRMHPRSLARAVVKSYQYKCNLSRASCRRFIALDKERSTTQLRTADRAARRRLKTANRGDRYR